MTLAQELAERAAGNGPAHGSTVAQLIKAQMPAIGRALPTTTDPARFAQIVLTECKRNPQLLTCDPMTLLGAMMTAAQLGLYPGPLGHAYLIPRKGQVQFQTGYRGMIDLALRGGQVLSIDAHVVYTGDQFEYRYGTEPFLDHTPNLEEPGDRRCVYAVAKLRAGGTVFRVLPFTEVERRRARGHGDTPAWRDDYDAMSMKTAIRALSPFIPQTPEFAEAQRLDDSVRTEIAPLEDVADPVHVENEAENGAAAGTTEVLDGSPSASVSSDPAAAADHGETNLDPAFDLAALRFEAQTLVDELAPAAQAGWKEWKRARGLSNMPGRWTEEQCRSVMEWIRSPLDSERL